MNCALERIKARIALVRARKAKAAKKFAASLKETK